MNTPEIVIRIELPWIPPAELRGNSRAHFQVKARHASELQERGIEYGIAAKTDHPHLDYPITGSLSLEVTAWNKRQVDYDNLLIGYKSFLDGLQEVVKRDKWGEVPGAGLIHDDSQIVEAAIRVRIGAPRTILTLRKCCETAS